MQIQYTNYVKAPCCNKCDYAHNMIDGMSLPYDICPKCGGEVTEVVGRWMYTEVSRWHDWFFRYGYPETVYHGFQRGAGDVKPPPPHPDNNYTLEGSLNAYKAGHK